MFVENTHHRMNLTELQSKQREKQQRSSKFSEDLIYKK